MFRAIYLCVLKRQQKQRTTPQSPERRTRLHLTLPAASACQAAAELSQRVRELAGPAGSKALCSIALQKLQQSQPVQLIGLGQHGACPGPEAGWPFVCVSVLHTEIHVLCVYINVYVCIHTRKLAL